MASHAPMYKIISASIVILAIIAGLYYIVAIYLPENTNSHTAKSHCTSLDRPIVIGEPNWKSAQVNTEIVAYIIKNGFGCDVEIIPGRTHTINEGLLNGNFDLTIEMWVNTAPITYQLALQNGSIQELQEVFTSEEGWYVPRHMVENINSPAYGLTHVNQLPEFIEALKTSSDKIPTFHNCVTGWFCEDVNRKKMKSYGLDELFITQTHQSLLGLNSGMAAADQGKEPWLGYYWTPTEQLSQLDFVKLEEPEYTDDCWNTNKKCAYPPARVMSVARTDTLSELDDELIAFLNTYSMSTTILEKYLPYNVESIADTFIANEFDIWSAWVSADVAHHINESSNNSNNSSSSHTEHNINI